MTNSGNIPCSNPRLCGVQSHRPGTEALCRNPSSGQATPKRKFGNVPPPAPGDLERYGTEPTPEMKGVFLDPEVDRLADEIVNGNHEEEEREELENQLMDRFTELGAEDSDDHWVAFHGAIRNKEQPPQPAEDTSAFGKEHFSNTQYFNRDAVRVDAGSRGGYLVIENDKKDDVLYNSGELIVVTDEETTIHSGDDGFFDSGSPIRIDSNGDLYFESDERPGSGNGAPIRIRDLQEGDRHWCQEDEDDDSASDKREWTRYELLRRLYDNPSSRTFMESHAQRREPRTKYHTPDLRG